MKKIEVLGSGCSSCKKLYELTKEVVKEMNLDLEVEYISDIQKIIEMGVMQSPVLAIDGRPLMVGSILNKEKIIELITTNIEINKSPSIKKPGCNCGGDC